MSASDVIVVDNGTGLVKAGFAADNLPRYSFPSMVGRPVLRAEEDVIGDVDIKDVMVGDEAAALRRALEISYPLENGVVRNWDDMEIVWRYLFERKMNVNPREKKVILTEPPLNPTVNRKRMLEVMLETFQFDAMQIAVQAMCTLYGQGLTTGLVLDSGDGVTHVVVVFDGFVPQHLTRRLDVAGRHISRHLLKLLTGRGYALNRTADFQTVQEIKERLCYVAMDPQQDVRLAEETTVLQAKYTLPDGRVIQLGRERFEAAEALFTPRLLDIEGPGMSDLVWDVINRAEVDMRSRLYQSIVLSGGTTMFPGLPSRLEYDLRQRYLRDVCKGDTAKAAGFQLNIEDPPRRKHMVFLGASTLGEVMCSHPDYWISRRDYLEEGADRVLAKHTR